MTLEELTPGARVLGVLPDQPVTVVAAEWHGTQALTLTYRDETGRVDHQLLYRANEAGLEVQEPGRAWSFDGDGKLFRLASEALRINLAHLFDPYLAVHTSNLDPLPHQIRAVYGEMLPRQPLRFLLADDPGAGKTIMAGLLIKELIVRGDLNRCMVVAPGSLVEQWQDELAQKLGLDFDIITRETIEASRSGNPFAERDLVICRLDQLSRSDDVQAKLEQTDWDLVVVDEAHKMSAHFYGNEVEETKRYKLGRLLGSLARHFLLMTATPHSGKPEDFQLFMALLDPDRFEGKPRKNGMEADAQGLMRRMVKEELLTFEGKRLFPERRAYTVNYDLSPEEARLYEDVTEYVREEMNRAQRLQAKGEGRRGNIVGFALTVLQRRLASSPEAIYQSLRRRRERLEGRVNEVRLGGRGADSFDMTIDLDAPDDPDEVLEGEREELEERVVDQASAAETIAELEAEIATLRRLEVIAARVRASGTDAKWSELARLLQDSNAEMLDETGKRRKLIIFSEHRDTLNYLTDRIRTLLGTPEAVVTIHGGMHREARRQAQEAFRQQPEVSVLVATDAAGEGVNLQRAHLLVNYDLPWNPNRIEQRFGRIHRIGQTEVCHKMATELRAVEIERPLAPLTRCDLHLELSEPAARDLGEGEPW
jgi:SNF2 family DNA or RNA helicase